MKSKFVFIVLCVILLSSALGVCAEGGGYLVKFKEGYCPDAYKYNLKEVNADRGLYQVESVYDLKAIEGYIEHISINQEATLIEGDEPVFPFSLMSAENESEYAQKKIINVEAGWNMGAYGNDVKVAVIDSGCYPHEELKNNLLPGKNYLSGTTDVTDNDGHGTHVSGIIAAELNGVGVAGVAPKAKIVPLKCFDPGKSTYASDLLAAVYDAVDVYGCKIINMSWGLTGDNALLKEAINYVDSKGVIMVAAVGNKGTTTEYYPAAYDNVIGVASVNAIKGKSNFSQYNTSVTVAALGERVKSTYKDGVYATIDGTSQAAPMVVGVAAVALSMDEKLTSAKFKQILCATAEDLGDEGYDVKYGYGLVNEAALVDKLMEEINYYVSPVNKKDNEAFVVIKNNTNEVFSASSILADYTGNKFNGCSPVTVTLMAGESTRVNMKTEGSLITHFLWKGLANIEPLVAERTIGQ